MEIKDKKIEEFFKAGRTEMPDDGFTHEVTSKLPPRHPWLPYLIIIASFWIGVSVWLFMVGSSFGWEVLSDAISEPGAATYGISIMLLLLTGSISFALYQTDNV